MSLKPNAQQREENLLETIVTIIIALVTIVFVYGIAAPQPCNGIDNDSLYCAVRSGFLNKVGAFMVFLTFAFLLVFKPIFGATYLPKGSVWLPLAVFAFAVLGVIITFTA